MRRFWFNLIWYLVAVVIADLLPIGIFYRLHTIGGMGSALPQIVASALFFILICIQAFAHLHQMNKRFPDQEDRNVWTTMIVTGLVVLTFWLIIAGLIFWATSSA